MSRRDIYEAEVQRRYTDLMASAGVNGSRVAVEILFMLPPEFVRRYAELFDLSLSWSPRSGSGSGSGGGSIEKASGAVKPDVRGSGEGGMHTRVQPAASTSGKRYTKQHFAVLSETALNEKNKLDRRLVRGVTDAIRAARPAQTNATTEIGAKTKERGECSECGRRMANGWKRCPFHSE